MDTLKEAFWFAMGLALWWGIVAILFAWIGG